MRKIAILFIAPFLLLSTLSAQITQTEADEIVKERLGDAITSCLVYAQEEPQTEGTTIATAAGETLELDYSCWVYYARFAENGKYLIVRESNGNVLEVNAKNDGGPSNLTEWREVSFEKPIEPILIGKGNLTGEEGIPKQNLIITNTEEWKSLMTAMNSINNVTDNFTETEIDFEQYQIIAIFDNIRNDDLWSIDIAEFTEYSDSIVIAIENLKMGGWEDAIIQPFHIVKIAVSEKKIIFDDPEEIPFTEYVTSTLNSYVDYYWENLDFPEEGELIIINSQEDLEIYLSYPDDFPPIDFSNHTLLLASGIAGEQVFKVAHKIQQLSTNEYKFYVALNIGYFLFDSWVTTILVDKLDEESVIELNVIYNTVY